MILNKYGEKIEISSKEYCIGKEITTTEESGIYYGLKGRITEIRTDKDKETDNEGVDIYCELYEPTEESNPSIAEIEERFSNEYEHKMNIEDICMDVVIMANGMIRQV